MPATLPTVNPSRTRFTKILIANRGEIACRVAATARRMGIATVAVYSDVDQHARHVQACDEAYRLGPAAARESYLRADAVIAAAKASGAMAIHPGYGFLSENESFASAVVDAGLIFIGPPAAAIAAMGNKSAAKTLMQKAGVPLVPGYHGADQDGTVLRREAAAVGYPVLIKASSGGGGKGMRIVLDDDAFAAALASCQREASASFGDAHVLLERYLQKPRHIEIQVFADTHGNYVYLFERDCSVQRRHQKVLEEAPAPNLDTARREAMGQAAVAAARAVGYVGAGTVEFIVNQDGSFFFMEMNTRLQVEHPVTELITGFDLVEWQLRIADGQLLPAAQDQLSINGHALEARIYAENPLRDFLPATGRLDVLRLPAAAEFSVGSHSAPAGATAVRIDSGIREGDTISPFYDPMIAKLIVWGSDRAEALQRMGTALKASQIAGVSSNLAFLARLIDNVDFASGAVDTGLIERWRDTLLAPEPEPTLTDLAFFAARILADETAAQDHDPWSSTAGFRLNASARRELMLEIDDQAYGITLVRDGLGMMMHVREQTGRLVIERVADGFSISLDHVTVLGQVERLGARLVSHRAGRQLVARVVDVLLQAASSEAEGGRLTAPMPGKIVAIHVAVGATVAPGDALLVMEAMKMEHTIAAPAHGTVAELLYGVGDQVADGAQLLVLDVSQGPR